MGNFYALIGRRLWQLLPIVVFATFVVFSLLQLVPGDPAVTLAGDYASKERIEEIRKLYGFDQPLDRAVRHLAVACACNGDLGTLAAVERAGRRPDRAAAAEHHSDRDLRARDRRRWSAFRSACWRQPASARALDAFVTSIASLGVALPSFWLAILLVATLSLELALVPGDRRARRSSPTPGGAIKHATLPAVALAVGVIAELARQVRSALIEVLNSQYVRTLRAKGLGPIAILWKHGLRNISVTLLTLARPAGQPPVLRRGRDRGGVRHSRRRQPRRLLGDQQGFSGGAGRRAGARDHRHPRSICWSTSLNALLDPRAAEE